MWNRIVEPHEKKPPPVLEHAPSATYCTAAICNDFPLSPGWPCGEVEMYTCILMWHQCLFLSFIQWKVVYADGWPYCWRWLSKGWLWICLYWRECKASSLCYYSGTSLKVFDEPSGLWKSNHMVAICFCQSSLMSHLMYISGLLGVAQSHFRRWPSTRS